MFIPIIPDLFTPYVRGRESAIQANQNDMRAYNDIQRGQLGNLMALETFGPSVQDAYNRTDASRLANLFALDAYNPRLQGVYNSANQGYLQNSLFGDTYDPSVRTAWNQADQTQMAADLARAQQPGAMTMANLGSMAARAYGAQQLDRTMQARDAATNAALSTAWMNNMANDVLRQNPQLMMQLILQRMGLSGAGGTGVPPADMDVMRQVLGFGGGR